MRQKGIGNACTNEVFVAAFRVEICSGMFNLLQDYILLIFFLLSLDIHTYQGLKGFPMPTERQPEKDKAKVKGGHV
jgi:hypothetical protein